MPIINFFYKFKKNKKSNKKDKNLIFKGIIHKLKKILPTVIQLISRCFDNKVLEINNLDFEKSFFCDSYIANRHLSGKKMIMDFLQGIQHQFMRVHSTHFQLFY
ncbi:MAG: hypothetical protein AB2993_05385 [Candidatus Symbiodolus clandestinus]